MPDPPTRNPANACSPSPHREYPLTLAAPHREVPLTPAAPLPEAPLPPTNPLPLAYGPK